MNRLFQLCILILIISLMQLNVLAQSQQELEPLYDMEEVLDTSTLKIEVIRDWHLADGKVKTRQKVITINVGELWKGQDYRIPVRFIVPAERKAKGFHLTGGHNQRQFTEKDFQVGGVDADLITGGVGLVHTIVQEPATFGKRDLAREMQTRFWKTLNIRYSIQYWGWPMTLMRSITAAYAEDDYFEKGKIAMSGVSKNGASPSAVLINDPRTTALHASVSPICDSPLRLCDKQAWDELKEFNLKYSKENQVRSLTHPFLGGTYGPIYTFNAIEAGNSWEEVEKLAHRVSNFVFPAKRLADLKKRNVDMLFHPGSHDFVAFDMAWCGKHYPEMPIYLAPNTGHGQKKRLDSTPGPLQNKTAFLLNHFFDEVEPLLESPSIKTEIKGKTLSVTVTFKPESKDNSGRIWWMYNRPLDGSLGYLQEHFPADQWKDMKRVKDNSWAAEIELLEGMNQIDLFSTHGKKITHADQEYQTFISSPYTRVKLSD